MERIKPDIIRTEKGKMWEVGSYDYAFFRVTRFKANEMRRQLMFHEEEQPQSDPQADIPLIPLILAIKNS